MVRFRQPPWDFPNPPPSRVPRLESRRRRASLGAGLALMAIAATVTFLGQPDNLRTVLVLTVTSFAFGYLITYHALFWLVV